MNVNSPLLKKFINFFWIIDTTCEDINHKVLPIKNIDLILNLSSNPTFISEENKLTSSGDIFFVGMTDKYKYNWINQKGQLKIIGISFFSTGLYPFLGIPLSEFKNKIINFELLKKKFSNELIDRIKISLTLKDRLEIIENSLLKLLEEKRIMPVELIKLFDNFCNYNSSISIELFCNKYGIHKRQLERNFNKYIGISPKSFLRINRFQDTTNQLLRGEYTVLSDLAYDNSYYDQMHFIKDFKTFTGSSPSQFINQRRSLKEISNFI